MKARYIIVLLFSLLGLSAQAQSIELIGLVPSADGGVSGRMILAKVNAGGEEICGERLNVELAARNERHTESTDSDAPTKKRPYLVA